MSATSPSSSGARPRRRWLRFGLRSLLIFVSLCGVVFYWATSKRNYYRFQKQVCADVRRLGGDAKVEPVQDPPRWLKWLAAQEDLPLEDVVELQWRGTSDEVSVSPMMRRVSELKALRKLDVDQFPLTDDDLAPLARLHNLESVSLGMAHMNGSGLAYLRNSPKLAELHFDDEHGYATDDGIASLNQLSSLETLSLVDYSAAPSIHRLDLHGLAKLRRLLLKGRLSEELALQDLPALEHLEIDYYNPVRVSLGRLPALTELSLVADNRTEHRTVSIAEGALPAVQSLTLNFGGTDAEIDAIIKNLSPAESLTVLGLSRNHLTADGLRHLARFPRLTVLWLVSNPALADSALASLAGLANLQRLSLGGTRITDNAIGRLSAALPSLEIISDQGARRFPQTQIPKIPPGGLLDPSSIGF